MNLTKTLVAYIETGLLYMFFDLLMLNKVAPKFYKRNLGHLMAQKPNLTAAAVFYFIYAAGLMVLAIVPAIDIGSLAHALSYGAMVGLVAYGTFDLTSQALFKNWPTKITVLDIIWGIVVSSVVAVFIYLLH